MQSPPKLLAAPALGAAAEIGNPRRRRSRALGRRRRPRLQWCRDGAAIAGATEASYTPADADDRTALSCRITASNAAGETSAETEPMPVAYAAPVVAGALADLDLVLDGDGGVAGGCGLQRVGAELRGERGRGDDRRRDRRREHPDRGAARGDHGHRDRDELRRQRLGELPGQRQRRGAGAGHRAGAAGSGQIGAAVSVDAGVWSGKPAPATAFQWRRDGVDIAGATGASYTPVAADDRTALSCRVTASNAAGEASAETASLRSPTPRRCAGTLPDLDLTLGDGRQRPGGCGLHRLGPELRGERGRGDDRRRRPASSASRPRRSSPRPRSP